MFKSDHVVNWRRHRGGHPVPLNRDVVLQAAVALLDETGLDELSTRRLAQALGVRVGALYWHYPSKQTLLNAIAEHIIADALAAPAPDNDWTCQIRTHAHALRDATLKHPDGARVVAEMTPPGPRAIEFFQRVSAVLERERVREAAAAADVVTSYVNGFTIEEQARKTDQPRTQRDATFELGLTVIINGLRELTGH